MDRLTAFVLKAFAQAQSHIFIEKTHITNAFNWLSMKQKENGCFQQSGYLLNNAMKVRPCFSASVSRLPSIGRGGGGASVKVLQSIRLER